MEIGGEESEERRTRGERREGGSKPPPPINLELARELTGGSRVHWDGSSQPARPAGGKPRTLAREFAAGRIRFV